ncbi:MAG: hypothetical protein K0Q95_802 [Bacteroidota bacterium]|nr:hypothetical protein [Bacteroidota bacterium]
MRTKISLIFLILFSLGSQAQISTIFADEFPDSAKTRIGINADYSIGSNNLTNEFLGKFYKGGFIDKDLKDEVLNRSVNKNRFGADINVGMYAAFKLDSLMHKKNISVFFAIKDRQHFDASFSKDLFKLGFYGNASYAGKTAYMNGFNMNLLRYQQIQIGLFSSKLDSAARWGIGLSFLKGEQYASVYAKTAELYTAEDGSYIDFNTSIEAAKSDTAKKGIGAFNGYGASVDIYFEAPFKAKFGDSKIRVSVSDIGLINYNQNTLYLKQDSLFHYTGFHVNSIYDLQDSTLSQNTSQDSVISAVAPFRKQEVSVTLPAILNLSFETRFSKNFELSEGIRYVFNANYNLLTYIKASFYFSPKFMLSTTLSYGGYSTFNCGIGAFANLGNGFIIYAGSNNIEGFIVPKKTTAQGVYISIVKNLK